MFDEWSRTMRRSDPLPANYPQFLAEIKAQITGARTRAVLAVNSELITLYWEIGHEILERQGREDWGSGVTKRLSSDVRRTFPDMKGLSETCATCGLSPKRGQTGRFAHKL
jgi:hypothetical protein